jgi:hypothetical protein
MLGVKRKAEPFRIKLLKKINKGWQVGPQGSMVQKKIIGQAGQAQTGASRLEG